MTLSKSDLLAAAEQVRNGTRHRETVELPTIGGEALVRPLSNPEASEVRRAQTRGITTRAVAGQGGREDVSMDMEIDLGEMAAGQAEAERVAARYGLSTDETWSEDDLSTLPDQDVAAIGRAVMALSGIEDAQREAERLSSTFRSSS